MSCSLWRWTEECDTRPCVGDCDFCGYNDEDEEEEEDGNGEEEHDKQRGV